MNISNISFCGSRNNNYREYETPRYNGRYAEQASHQRETLRKSSGLDTYERTAKSNTRNSRKQQKPINPYKLALLGLALLKVGTMAHSCATEPEKTVDINVNAGTAIVEIADTYGVDEDIIKGFNGLTEDTIPYSMQITIPSEFEHPLEDKIEDLQEDLFSDKLNAEERAELEEKIQNMKEVQEIQSDIAKAYTDGKYVYFQITLPTDETATEIQKEYKYGYINVEKFKDIFGIKDGVIKKYNNIGYSWASDEYGSYKDFTTNSLHNGTIIKVPVSAVSVKNIEALDD